MKEFGDGIRLCHFSLPYTGAHRQEITTVVLPNATLLHWAHGSPYSLSCGEQVPDVGIPHYRDARMQHSPIQCPSTLHTG